MKKLFTILAMCFGVFALNAQNATIVLTAGDVFGDGTGYQMLFDKDTLALDDSVTVSALTSNCGSAYDATVWDYTIPANATGADAAVIVNNSGTLQLPEGWYDYIILNPGCTDFGQIYIASSQCDPAYNRVYFESGKTYTFSLALSGTYDCTTITVTGGDDPTPGPGPGVGISETDAQTFGLYPNPATEVLNVKANDVKEIEIVNMLGQTVITTNVQTINVASLTNGVYFVRVNYNNGTVSTQKFVKE
ncbi:MAG: DUF2436 domain-containing protein [Bacteroidales bacterium]|nr:DUF2436 domain-containing protein [Bacteroidales bacterium]